MTMMPVTSKAAEPKKETTSAINQEEGKKTFFNGILLKKILGYAIMTSICFCIGNGFIFNRSNIFQGAILGFVIGFIFERIHYHYS